VGAIVHVADLQDRDGAPQLLQAIHAASLGCAASNKLIATYG
jgi:hypothetical protein